MNETIRETKFRNMESEFAFSEYSFLTPTLNQLEKEMVTHSSILAWRIPWTGEPGGLWSMELQRVRHD